MNHPRKPSQASIKEKRSEFIGLLFPVSRVEDVKEHLRSLRKCYHTARHICWAYRIQDGIQLVENSSDAGEPAGTAGAPILNELRKNEIVNGALFVVRIFGGIKLGKKGLAQAYGLVAGQAVAAGEFMELVSLEKIFLECPLEFYGDLSHLITKFGGRILEDQSTDKLVLRLEFPADQWEAFSKQAVAVTRGTGRLTREEGKTDHETHEKDPRKR